MATSIHGLFGAVRVVLLGGTLGFFALSTLKCSSSTGSGGGNSGGSSSGGSGGSIGNNDGSINVEASLKDYSADQFFADDPPPMGCDGGGNPVVPGGTPDCPNDKNLPGCPCPTLGETAPCWPGYRKNRNRGDCADGTTTCGVQGELGKVWGECQGYTGIDPNTFQPLGATGKAACTCFSGGYWDLQNLSPCFIFSAQPYTGANCLGAGSGVVSGNTVDCNQLTSVNWSNPTPPSAPWSTDEVTVDCTGYFKLCYTIKALSAPMAMPQAGDCVVKEICSEAYYAQKDVAQTFPPLKGWVTNPGSEQACAKKFIDNGGYGEMSVDGESDECDHVKKVFQQSNYCPFKCNDAANAMDPECVNCMQGGGGPF